MKIQKIRNLKIRKYGNWEYEHKEIGKQKIRVIQTYENMEVAKYENMEIQRLGNMKMRKQGNLEIWNCGKQKYVKIGKYGNM